MPGRWITVKDPAGFSRPGFTSGRNRKTKQGRPLRYRSKMISSDEQKEVIIVGGGLAGLSAAIYLGRAKRRTLVIDAGRSLALWEPDVRNYLGFPDGISGEELLKLAGRQARLAGAE